jgi:hypothetical protein
MLYGRDVERARVSELLDGARESRGGALVVCGEPGVGKSALLADARERAVDMQVLSAVGVESEAELPFAGLHQLVRPVLGFVEVLPGAPGGCVAGGARARVGAAADRFLVSLGALSLLAAAAEHGPLLCLVDDAHWLDDASADALVFVARRIEEEGIVVLFAVREGAGTRVEGLPELRLGGLDREAAAGLLDHRVGVVLSADARERLFAASGGNPLALLELPAALSEQQRSGADPWLAPLPLGARLERAFLARVRELEADTQTVLLVAAAEDSGELSVVLRAAAGLGARADALDGAERAGLARVIGGRVERHHPLVRSALYHAAPLSRRRAAHRALADVLDDEADADRRAWHLAAAGVEPDLAVAEELERAAERARTRSGFAAAALALERAAVLTDDRQVRARRLIAATENAWLGGRLERASALLERARPLAGGAIQRADIDRCAGLLEMTSGDQVQACRLLMRAAGEVAPLDGERALQQLSIARILATHTGDDEAGVSIGELARAAGADSPVARILRESLLGSAPRGR